MSTIEFPFNHLCPIPSYSLAAEDNLLRNEADAGVVITRKRYTKTRKAFTVKWNGNDNDFATAENFFYNTINSGVDSFYMVIRNVNQNILFKGIVQLTKPYVPTYNGLGTWEFEYSVREV